MNPNHGRTSPNNKATAQRVTNLHATLRSSSANTLLDIAKVSTASSQLETATTEVYGEASVSEDDTLGPYDIICGRNKLAFNNIGNRRFRITITLVLDRYMAATTKLDTSNVIKYVSNIVRENGGRFLKRSRDDRRWIELDEKEIREKVGHALRDAVTTQRASLAIRTRQLTRSQHNVDDTTTIPVSNIRNDTSASLNAFAFRSTTQHPSRSDENRLLHNK
jgi:hypothetical protein